MKLRVTTETLRKMKREGQKIAMLTAYDYSTASALDNAGVDVLLVGDSLGNVVLGYETTIPVTMEDMIHHTKPVVRAAKRALVLVDLPFMSYHSSVEKAIENAGALLQKGGAHAVKLEGGAEMAETVARISAAGIPVMGHVGLTPQSIHLFGGYSLRAKETATAKKLLDDVLALQEAGAFGVVLEKIPAPLAKIVTEKLDIPTIGIGAGPDCDGQVLVVNDVLGYFDGFSPKFAKKYADLASIVSSAAGAYVNEVKNGVFPAEEHAFPLDKAVIEELRRDGEGTR